MRTLNGAACAVPRTSAFMKTLDGAIITSSLLTRPPSAVNSTMFMPSCPIVFVEELNHALHAALQFKNGQRRIASEEFARDLELQAQVDTYLVLLLFVAFFRKTQRVSRTDRRWLRFHLFTRQCPDAFRDQNLRGRYLETCELAASYTQYLDTLNGVRRLDEIRKFRSLDYSAKKAHIFALMERTT